MPPSSLAQDMRVMGNTPVLPIETDRTFNTTTGGTGTNTGYPTTTPPTALFYDSQGLKIISETNRNTMGLTQTNLTQSLRQRSVFDNFNPFTRGSKTLNFFTNLSISCNVKCEFLKRCFKFNKFSRSRWCFNLWASKDGRNLHLNYTNKV